MKSKKPVKKSSSASFPRKLFRLLAGALIIILLVPTIQLIVYKFVDPPFTWLMLDRKFLPEDGFEIHELRHSSVPMEQISKSMVFAVMSSEDQTFLDHNGLDVDAIEKALEYNETHKKKRGASTISQQTAKNAFLWESRSWLRKGLEVPLTFAIEVVWGKARIMEIYLNIAELGPGVFGVESASQYWFHKPASRLSRHQAALLAACLPAPRKFNPGRPSAYLNRRAAWIERQIGFMDQGRTVDELEIPTKHGK